MAAFPNGIAFINPIYNSFVYARRTALSFFKHTPEELHPVCLNVDDCSPRFAEQNWNFWHEGLPADRCIFHHFEKNNGLTRSWNWGLRKARELGCRYAIAGNSDILFTEGWYEGLMWHLQNGAQLVGPVTNAPGLTDGGSGKQNVRHYYPGYKVSDEAGQLEKVARHLKATHPIEKIVQREVNGFFLMSTVDTWWQGAFDEKHVFDPKYRLTGNEDELEKRWRGFSWKIGFVPSSFIFHYRSVSRGDKHKSPGWARLDDIHKPV